MKQYLAYNALQDWFETCDNNGQLLLIDNQVIPSENDELLGNIDLCRLYDFVAPVTGRANRYTVTTPATVTPYGNYYRIARKGIITLLN